MRNAAINLRARDEQRDLIDQAARLLGLSRNALRYRLSKIGIADEGEKEA